MIKHAVDHDEWQDMKDMIERFENELGAFEQKHPTALYKFHWRIDPDFPKRRDVMPIGNVFEALVDGVEIARQEMPEEPEEWTEEDQAEYDADFQGKQEREERA